MQAFKPDRYKSCLHDKLYMVGIYQLFAELVAKIARTGKGQLTVDILLYYLLFDMSYFHPYIRSLFHLVSV